ncbi:MAG: ribonuclease P protein component [Chitinophagaceae bacterium]|nr:MAG: ribonuclease P protein component [Chitinophagaceae bacterium]
MAKTFTIGKTERLKSRKLIDQLFSSGRRFNAGPFRVSFAMGLGEGKMQFGVGAGTRNFKRAHDRNRIKRLTRESWRLANGPLKQQLAEQRQELNVFVLYTGKELPEYAAVARHMTRIIDNLLRFSNEKNTLVP